MRKVRSKTKLFVLLFFCTTSILAQEKDLSGRVLNIGIDLVSLQKHWVQPNTFLKSENSNKLLFYPIPGISITTPIKSFEVGIKYGYFMHNYLYESGPGDYIARLEGKYIHNKILLIISKKITGNTLELYLNIASGVTLFDFEGVYSTYGGFIPSPPIEAGFDISGIGVPIELGVELRYPLREKLSFVLNPSITIEKLFNYSDTYYSLNDIRFIPIIDLGIRYRLEY